MVNYLSFILEGYRFNLAELFNILLLPFFIHIYLKLKLFYFYRAIQGEYYEFRFDSSKSKEDRNNNRKFKVKFHFLTNFFSFSNRLSIDYESSIEIERWQGEYYIDSSNPFNASGVFFKPALVNVFGTQQIGINRLKMGGSIISIKVEFESSQNSDPSRIIKYSIIKKDFPKD